MRGLPFVTCYFELAIYFMSLAEHIEIPAYSLFIPVIETRLN
jgi:hypothetical protein